MESRSPGEGHCMRVTVLILSLLLGAVMFFQTVLVSGLGSMA
jgi:hypothetical protein